MWELDHKEGWASKNWCFWTVVLEKTLESPLDCKEIQPVNPKRNQPWIFIGRTDAEAETPILWSPDAKSWLIRKDPDVGTDWRQKEKGDDRGGDGWIASATQCTWVWANPRRRWRTGKPGMLQSMGSQRVGHDPVTEQNKEMVSDFIQRVPSAGAMELPRTWDCAGRWSKALLPQCGINHSTPGAESGSRVPQWELASTSRTALTHPTAGSPAQIWGSYKASSFKHES